MNRSALIGGASGVLFGVGLVISGMTDPANIKAFLDVTGDWDPKLALVMAGAVGVYAIAIRWPRREAPSGPRAASISSGSSVPPEARLASPAARNARGAKRVDLSLVVGAGLFGVGWGLSGYCPGPSIVSLGFGGAGVVVFVVASLAGVLLSDLSRTALGDGSPSTGEQLEQGEVAKAT